MKVISIAYQRLFEMQCYHSKTSVGEFRGVTPHTVEYHPGTSSSLTLFIKINSVRQEDVSKWHLTVNRINREVVSLKRKFVSRD